MNCPSELTCSIYADGALAAPDALKLERHLRSCATCRGLVAQLRNESCALRTVLQGAAELAAIPKLERPLGPRAVGIFGAGAAAIGWLVAAVWGGLAAAVPVGFRWLNPLDAGDVLDSSIAFILYMSQEGTAMLTSILNTAAAAVLLAALVWAVVAVSRNRSATAVVVSVLLLVAALPSYAFELRRDELATLSAEETVDDTLIALGETISIDGNVTGDLLAFGRRVTIRGTVMGNVISAAESVTIEGTVGGTVVGAASSVRLVDARVGRNLFGFARDVSIGSNAQVDGNAAMFGENVDVSGGVLLDVRGYARAVEIRGNVAGNVDAHAGQVNVLGPAEIGGNLTAHVVNAEDLRIASGATIGGAVATRIVENGPRQGNRYLSVSFYVRQVVRFGAAFVTGLLLLWLVPGLRSLSLRSGAAVLKAGGIGLIALVTVPVAALIACVTVIGIPVGFVGAMLWLLGLYFAKIVLAQALGVRMFQSSAGSPHYTATLIAGLVVVLIVVNIPFVGWLVNLVLTCVGLGLIVDYTIARLRGSEIAPA